MTGTHRFQCPQWPSGPVGAHQGLPSGKTSVSNVLKGSSSNKVRHKTEICFLWLPTLISGRLYCGKGVGLRLVPLGHLILSLFWMHCSKCKQPNKAASLHRNQNTVEIAWGHPGMKYAQKMRVFLGQRGAGLGVMAWGWRGKYLALDRILNRHISLIFPFFSALYPITQMKVSVWDIYLQAAWRTSGCFIAQETLTPTL